LIHGEDDDAGDANAIARLVIGVVGAPAQNVAAVARGPAQEGFLFPNCAEERATMLSRRLKIAIHNVAL